MSSGMSVPSSIRLTRHVLPSSGALSQKCLDSSGGLRQLRLRCFSFGLRAWESPIDVVKQGHQLIAPSEQRRQILFGIFILKLGDGVGLFQSRGACGQLRGHLLERWSVEWVAVGLR